MRAFLSRIAAHIGRGTVTPANGSTTDLACLAAFAPSGESLFFATAAPAEHSQGRTGSEARGSYPYNVVPSLNCCIELIVTELCPPLACMSEKPSTGCCVALSIPSTKSLLL